MMTRIQDGLFGWTCSVYLPAVFCIFGINIHWVAIAFGCVAAINLSLKIWGFLWNKLIVAVAKEMNKQNDLNM